MAVRLFSFHPNLHFRQTHAWEDRGLPTRRAFLLCRAPFRVDVSSTEIHVMINGSTEWIGTFSQDLHLYAIINCQFSVGHPVATTHVICLWRPWRCAVCKDPWELLSKACKISHSEGI